MTPKPFTMTRPFLMMLVAAQRGCCAACGVRMNLSRRIGRDHKDAPTLDHVWALGRGGTDSLGNLIAMHWKCNNRKANRPPTGCEIIWGAAVEVALRDVLVRLGL